MGYRGWWRDPINTMFGQWEGAQEGRGNAQGVDSRADVVPKPWQREFCSAHTATNGVSSLDDEHRMTSACQRDGCGEAIGPRADDDRVAGVLCGHMPFLL